MNEDKVIQKLEEHDRRFDANDKRFDIIDQRFDEHGRELGRFNNEFNDFKHQVLTAQDEMMIILRRLDEERLFTTRWVERIEKEVEQHSTEIARVKKELKIA